MQPIVVYDTNILLSGVGWRGSPYLGFLQVIKITNTLKAVPTDPEDNKVIECAVVGLATHIVTGDRRHLLPLGNYQGIFILTAADFLAQLS